ncbi:MAG: methionine synthase [Chloroflexi bacterium]|nr:methionine synthase [Chloroflexota bacterium]
MNRKFEPNWLPMSVGSVPHTNPYDAWDLLRRTTPQIPCWPQLPRRSFFENMYVQYSEGFPGVVIEDERIYVDTDSPEKDKTLELLYMAYLENRLSYAAISPKYAAGLAVLLEEGLSVDPPPIALKGQVTGPISWGLTVVDQNRRPILYDEILADAVAKLLRLKASWQERELQQVVPQTIIFVDEPYMASFGSAFVSLSREQVITLLNEVLAGIEGLKGVHCCGNTDWSILLSTPIDILNLDAYNYAHTIALYTEEVSAFLDRGGIIAWGIVPASTEAVSETITSLVDRLEQAIQGLADKGVSRDKLLAAGLVTPSCGTGSLSEDVARLVLELTAGVSMVMRRRYGLSV